LHLVAVSAPVHAIGGRAPPVLPILNDPKKRIAERRFAKTTPP
jgi:hypothetical protein